MTDQESKNEFEAFKHACFFWITRFGMTDWDIRVDEAFLGVGSGQTYAQAQMNVPGRIARIILNASREDSHSALIRTTPEKAALHEVLHILLAPISQECSETDEHAIVHRLVKALT